MSQNNKDLIKKDDNDLLQNLQREHTIMQVLSLLLFEKDENGNKYSVEKACRANGISKATWYNWAEEGLISGPLQKVSAQMNQIAHDTILPNWGTVLQNMVSLAMGVKPEGSSIKSVKASDMIAAFKELAKIAPISPITEQSGQTSELEHVKNFQPQQFVVHGNMNFIYQGDGGNRFGELESIADQLPEGGDSVEGEATELDTD